MPITSSAAVGPVISEVMSLWGGPGIVAAVAIAAFIWWTRATSGLSAEKETTIARQDTRISALVAERDKAIADRDKWRESYYAVKYPKSVHEDVAAREGLDQEQG